MANFLVVAEYDGDNKILSLNSFIDEADAQECVTKLNDLGYADAFYCNHPAGGDVAHWTVNGDGDDVIFDSAAHDAEVSAAEWDTVRNIQRQMIEVLAWQVERYISQRELGVAEGDRDLTSTQYNDLLQHLQNIREQDEATHSTPEDAIAALDALVSPV